MATTTLQSIHHSLPKRQYLSDTPPPPTFSSSLSLKPKTPTTSLSLSSTTTTTTFSLSSTTSSILPSTTSETISFDTLQHHLATQNFRQADEETRRLVIVLAGEAAQKRGYVFFSEVQFISESDLKAIDELWKHHSNNRFGYSVQKKIFEKADKDFSKFFIKVGWMKKLETEVEQYNYRSFPDEFVWELNDDTPPEGHLPLTNALRGTQLLKNILNHPAFITEEEDKEEEEEEEDKVGKDEGSDKNGGFKGLKDSSKPMRNDTVFKPDYSF